MSAIRFANSTIIAAIVFFGILLGFAAVKGTAIYYPAFLAGLLGFLLLSLKGSAEYRVKLALVLVSTGVTLAAADLAIGAMGLSNPLATAAKTANVFYEKRSYVEVVDELSSTGVDAFPDLAAGVKSLAVAVKDEDFFPLGGISNHIIVFSCNEDGTIYTYESDEHGFNNPKEIWGQAQLEIATVGDSFTYGACIGEDRNFSAIIRGSYPKTLNVGWPDFGPLGQLTIMKEYLSDLKPKFVLWFYWEGNDLTDLARDRAMGLPLWEYLETDYRQNLIVRQDAIDLFLTQYVNRKMAAVKPPLQLISVSRVLLLRNIRERLVKRLSCIRTSQYNIEPLTLNDFDRILVDARAYVKSWQGELIFVYLPSQTRYVDPSQRCENWEDLVNMKFHDQVIAMARQRGLHVIDMVKILDAHPDPLSLWPFRMRAHFNSEGHQLVAETLLQTIDLSE